MDSKEKFLIEKSEVILNEIKKGETCDAEVYATHSTEMKVVYEASDFSISTNHTNTMFGIRTVVNGRLGFSTTNATDDQSLKDAAREAVMVARLSPPSEFHQIASKEMAESHHMDCWDENLAQLPLPKAYEYAQTVVDTARRDERISIDRSELSLNTTQWSILNSKGIQNSSRQTNCGWYVMGMGKTKDQVTSFDYDGGSASHLNKISGEIEKTISRFRDGVVQTLNTKHGESYKGAVLLHPAAVLDLISDVVEFNCNGRSQQDGMSPWKDMVGQAVAVPQLNIYEDPRNLNRHEGWTPFDREGVRTQKHNLIESGKLNFVAHNCFSAKRGGIQPTGNAVGGARGLPGIGFHNLTIVDTKGGTPEAEIFKKVKNGLVLKRFSGNSDPTSGVFSGIAKNSWWLKDGDFAFPVQEVMVSGNLFELLKSIQFIGKELHHYGSGEAPYILVDGLSVTAN